MSGNYTCSVCGKEFDEEEYKLTNDDEKCILHCEKDDWYEIRGNHKYWNKSEEKIKYFWQKVRNLLKKKNDIVFKKTIFPKFEVNKKRSNNFKEIRSDDGLASQSKKYIIEKSIYFSESIFLDDVDFENYEFSQIVLFGDAKFFGNCNLLKSKFKEVVFSETHFYKDVNIIESNVEVEKALFNSCIFKEKFALGVKDSNLKGKFFSYQKGRTELPKLIELKRSEFDDFQIYHYGKDINIYIENCNFSLEFFIYDCKYIGSLSIFNSSFKNEFFVSGNSIEKFILQNSEINENISLNNNIIKEFTLNATMFNDFVDFKSTKFLSDVSFNNVHFEEKVNFSDVIIKGKLNLRECLFYSDANFLDITSEQREKNENDEFIGEPKDIKVANRETARIIKNFYDNSNNIIEANRFYKLEMIEKEKELRFLKNPFEWLVFKFHGISSNHSQNWILALFWIISIPFIYILFGTVDNIDSIVYNIHIKGFWNEIANLINPFSIMTKGETLTFGMLLFKVTIAYLIYQFIISIRQNTRRK